MTPEELRQRTRTFALDVIKVAEALPRNRTCDVLGRQLIRCGTSVAANYRASCRARSQAEFIAKMGIVEEEADETAFWLDMLVESRHLNREDATELVDEAGQLVAIAVASINTARKRVQQTGTAQSAIRNPQSAIRDA
jgi:four helix bundle protein